MKYPEYKHFQLLDDPSHALLDYDLLEIVTRGDPHQAQSKSVYTGNGGNETHYETFVVSRPQFLFGTKSDVRAKEFHAAQDLLQKTTEELKQERKQRGEEKFKLDRDIRDIRGELEIKKKDLVEAYERLKPFTQLEKDLQKLRNALGEIKFKELIGDKV